jgi:hypothetical protein
METKRYVILMVLMLGLLLSIQFVAAEECTVLTTDETYTLIEDTVGCFVIEGSNVEFDGAGFTLTPPEGFEGAAFEHDGFFSEAYISNVNVEGFTGLFYGTDGELLYIDDVTFVGQELSGENALYLSRMSDVHITNVEMTHSGDSELGFLFDVVTNVYVEDSTLTFEGIEESGIYVESSNDVHFTNNVFNFNMVDSEFGGFEVADSLEVIFIDNSFFFAESVNYDYGMILWGSENIYFENNIFEGKSDGFIMYLLVVDDSDVVLNTFTVVDSVLGKGVFVSGSENVFFESNSFTVPTQALKLNSGEYDFNLNEVVSTEVVGEDGLSAILVQSDVELEMEGNTIEGSRTLLEVEYGNDVNSDFNTYVNGYLESAAVHVIGDSYFTSEGDIISSVGIGLFSEHESAETYTYNTAITTTGEGSQALLLMNNGVEGSMDLSTFVAEADNTQTVALFNSEDISFSETEIRAEGVDSVAVYFDDASRLISFYDSSIVSVEGVDMVIEAGLDEEDYVVSFENVDMNGFLFSAENLDEVSLNVEPLSEELLLNIGGYYSPMESILQITPMGEETKIVTFSVGYDPLLLRDASSFYYFTIGDDGTLLSAWPTIVDTEDNVVTLDEFRLTDTTSFLPLGHPFLGDITPITPSEGSFYNGADNVEVLFPFADFVTYEIYTEGFLEEIGDNVEMSYAGESIFSAPFAYADLEDGIYEMVIYGIDVFGDAEDEVDFTFTLDRTLPVVTLDCTSGLDLGQDVDCTCSATDDSGIESQSFETETFTPDSIGTFEHSCTATDVAGNEATDVASYTVREVNSGSGGGGSGGSGGGGGSSSNDEEDIQNVIDTPEGKVEVQVAEEPEGLAVVEEETVTEEQEDVPAITGSFLGAFGELPVGVWLPVVGVLALLIGGLSYVGYRKKKKLF